MPKIDYKKTLGELYRPSARKVVAVDPPALRFLMIDGAGDPGTSPAFQEALETLYPVAYTLKFMMKRGETGIDYAVMPLEGLWWADDMNDFVNANRENWQWTLMIMQPEMISGAMVDEAIAEVRKKKSPSGIDKLRFARYDEGRSAQTLHVGPFDQEGPTIERVHGFIEASGHRLSGKHHEIYLNDMRRTAPPKLKTIIRQPFA